MENKNKNLAPFRSSFTPQVPQILHSLNCTIALSTYQAGKVIFLSAEKPNKLIQLTRNFEGATGIASKGDKLAVACKSELNLLRSMPKMAKHYPPKPDTYDTIYMPTATYHTGMLSLHDLNFIGGKLIAVNRLFSNLSEINASYSFEEIWRPPFISESVPEDRCHLNGMATDEGKIKYVSALGETNSYKGWHKNKLTGGIIINAETGKTVMRKLQMPHSPRIYEGKLYFLQSASGELIETNVKKQTWHTLAKFEYFLRGMSKHGDYLFIGHSKLRHQASTFKGLPKAEKSTRAGVIIFHLPTKSVAGHVFYENSVDDIYDVKILTNVSRPNILNPEHDSAKLGIFTDKTSYWAISDDKTNQK